MGNVSHPAEISLMRFKHGDDLISIQEKLKELFIVAKFDNIIKRNEIAAVKVHFGEDGNTSYIPVDYISPIVEKIKELKANPFVTDSNVLYKSRRDNAINHINLAREHGFSLDSLGAPIIIADGLLGTSEVEVEVNAPMNKNVNIASEFVRANSIIMVTHATGHLITGLGSNIKNLGMGCASRKGKLVQHTVSKPFIDFAVCSKCLSCIKWCPVDAITNEENVSIDDSNCIGCGECLAVCREGAVKFRWDTSSADLQKQIAEHALGIVKQKKGNIAYFTFLINMTKDCDCLKQDPINVIDDIGVIVGRDPVALDQAVLDLTREVQGKDLSHSSYPAIDPSTQLSYGENIGLGIRKYKLKEFV